MTGLAWFLAAILIPAAGAGAFRHLIRQGRR